MKPASVGKKSWTETIWLLTFERRRVVNENLARREAHPEILGHIR